MLTVGKILRRERKKKGISLTEVEKELKVRKKFLQAVEENNWDRFPSKIYIIGIIRNYARYLNLDPERIVAFFRRDYERKESLGFKRRISSHYLKSDAKKLIAIAIGLVFFVFFIYFGYQLKLYLSPPKVVLLSPKKTRFRVEKKLTIVGKADKESEISIFGEKIYPNDQGIFKYNFPLKEGKNELVIKVIGANGKKTVLKKVFYKEKTSLSK